MNRFKDTLPTFIEAFTDSFDIFGNSHRLNVDLKKSDIDCLRDDMEAIGGDFRMVGVDLREAMLKISKEHPPSNDT